MASGSTLFKYGCFGCLGIIVLVAVSLAVVIGIAKTQAGKTEMTEEAIRPELPPDLFELPDSDAVATGSETVPAVGTIELDLSGAEFHIEPAAEGESLHADAIYDKNIYVFEESLTTSDTGPWLYRLTFRKAGAGLLATINEMFSKKKPKVTVYLPADRPVALDLRMSKGGAEVELGGLWLTEADIKMEMGGIALEVSTPMQAPMNRFSASASMGGFAAGHLGNASPRVLEVDASMGGMALDLRGRWRTDSDVTITFSMGGADLRLPEGVRFEGLAQPGVAVQDTGEIPLPTLKFDIRGDTENMEIRYP